MADECNQYVLTPEAVDYFRGVSEKLKNATAPKSQAPVVGVHTQGMSQNNDDTPLTVLEHLCKDIPDSYPRNAILKKFEGWASKELDTIDVASLLAASVSPRIAKLRRLETKFKNLCDSQRGQKPRVTDWLYRVKEERIGTQYAPAFNPDGDLPPQDQTIYSQQINALMFVGETLQQSIVASDMVNVQANLNLMAEEVDNCIIRIMESENRYLLRGQLQTSFAPNNITQMEGFETGSTLNNIDLMNNDLNHDYITMGQETIAGYFGQDVQMGLMVPSRQVQILDILEANYYPGQTSAAQIQLEDTLAARLESAKVPYHMVYRPKRGGLPIPVIREVDLIPNTAMLFVLDHPMEAEFMLGGQPGPHTLTRFTERLVYMAVCFKGFTGDFPLKEGRIRYNNVNM